MSNDPTATSGIPAKPQPGWYPDPSGEPLQRWWDGDGWTAQTYNPAGVATTTAPKQVAAGTPVYTPWIWLIVALPLISIASLLSFDFTEYLRASLESSTASLNDPTAAVDPFAGFDTLLTPGYIALVGLSWGIYLVSVLFAFLDRRELVRRGFDRPFHWAWAFLGATVYIIGRSVIVRRRAGTGLAPIWWTIAVIVLSIIVSLVVIGSAYATVLPEFLPEITSAP